MKSPKSFSNTKIVTKKVFKNGVIMLTEQSWRTEEYKGMDVHVTALPHDRSRSKWDYTVRVTDPGTDSSAVGALATGSGDDGDFLTEEAAVEAGFARGYVLVDKLKS
jgi:hypothetical protein